MQKKMRLGRRTEAHSKIDFRDVYYSKPETALGLHMDQCSLAVVQGDDHKYVHFAAPPPLFFDLKDDPGQFASRAVDPAGEAGDAALTLGPHGLTIDFIV